MRNEVTSKLIYRKQKLRYHRSPQPTSPIATENRYVYYESGPTYEGSRHRRSRSVLTIKLPSKILYPTEFFPTENQLQQNMLDRFVTTLEDYLGVKRIVFSLKEKWIENTPEAAMGQPLEEFLREVFLLPV